MDPRDAIMKMDTGDLAAGGLLLPEQVKTFYEMIFDIAPFTGLCRKLQMSAKVGEVDKIAPLE